MDGDHADTQLPGGAYRARHGIRNLVQLQIEEDSLAAGDKFAHHVRAARDEQLHPDLDRLDLRLQPLNERQGLGRGIEVERDDDG